MPLNDELDQLLTCEKISDEDWAALYEICGLKSLPAPLARRKVVNEEIRHAYGHIFVNAFFRDEFEPGYDEILKATAEKMGVAVKDHHTLAMIEDKLIVEAIDSMKGQIIKEKGGSEWRKIEDEINVQVQTMAAEGKYDQAVAEQLRKYKDDGVVAALLGGQLIEDALYQVSAITFLIINRALGLGTAKINAQMIGGVLASLFSPAALWLGGLWLLGNTNWKKSIPAVLTVAIYRRKYGLVGNEQTIGDSNMAKDPIYKNSDALIPVEKLVAEAAAAIDDPKRIVSQDSGINEALALAGGVGAGGAIGYAALYFAGVTGLSAAGISSGLAAAGALIGGGMTAGVAVIAAPAVLIGVGAYAWAAQRNKKLLIEKKEMLLQEVLKKHNTIISELNKTAEGNKDRINYLTRLNTLLQAAIQDLKSDLAIKYE